MEAKDYVTIAISVVALGVSLWNFKRGWTYNLANLRRTARSGYMTAQLDVDRQLVANPQLWQVYGLDIPALPRPGATAPDEKQEAGRRLAFIWYHLNLYELVYSEYKTNRVAELDRDESLYWESWDRYIRSFLSKSAEARDVVASPESMKLFNSDFAQYLQRCAKPFESKSAT